MARRVFRVLVVLACVVRLPAAIAAGADCPAASEQAWQQAADRLGLVVIEPERHIVGTAPGNTKTWPLANDLLGAGDNWFPLDIDRKTLCGGVDRWSVFEHPFSGEEHDLHAHVRPLPAFSYLLDESAMVAGKLDHVLGCKSTCTNDCPKDCQTLIYSEVTPDARVRDGDHPLVKASAVNFPKDPADIDAFGRLACVYGPWVRESFHESIPEIHPSEVIGGPSKDGSLRHLLVLRDRSQRFEQAQRFAWIPGPWWKPWTSAGTVEVRVAVLADSGGTPTLTIHALAPSPTQHPPTTRPIKDGSLEVEVIDETGAFAPKLEKLCPENGDRRAFAVLQATVDATGFLAASLELKGGSLPPLPAVPEIRRPPTLEAATAAPGLLERDSLKMVDGRLVGRFAYEKPDGTIGRREEPIDLSAVGARTHLDPTADRVARYEAKLPRTAGLWGFNSDAQTPGREWSVASRLRAELALFLEMGNGDRGATEILVEELARAIDDESRRSALFGAARPFAVHWNDLRITDIEAGKTYDQDAARKAGIDVRCFQGELGTMESCFPSRLEAAPEAEAQLVRRVGVLGGLLVDSGRMAPALPPATLKIVVSGRVKGPLGEFPFEETFLNHGPGKLVDYKLTGPRSWQLDDDQLTPGLLDGLVAALRPGHGAELKAKLKLDWAHDEANLSQQVLDPAQRPKALRALEAPAGRKARVFLLYAQALSRAGLVSDCSSVTPCEPAAEASANAEKAKVECARLRDLACSYWKTAEAHP